MRGEEPSASATTAPVRNPRSGCAANAAATDDTQSRRGRQSSSVKAITALHAVRAPALRARLAPGVSHRTTVASAPAAFAVVAAWRATAMVAAPAEAESTTTSSSPGRSVAVTASRVTPSATGRSRLATTTVTGRVTASVGSVLT